MMRGAQCAGVVSYIPDSKGGTKGIRTRVMNGKRTDLSELVASGVTGALVCL